MTKRINAVVTAGGTREPIDSVRYISNTSSGKFGLEIARALAEKNVDTNLVASKLLAKFIATDEDRKRLNISEFDSTADLAEVLGKIEKPNILFMSAAVADFSPTPEDGKIDSGKVDELVIRCHKTPKLLAGFRKQFGVETFLVGFKLLTGVTREELIRVARKQLQDYCLNLVVANDLATIKDGVHPILVITPEGGVIPISGTKTEVARKLVDFVLKRYLVTWFKSLQISPFKESSFGDLLFEQATKFIRLVQSMNLLPDTNGNISHRGQGGNFWITPRRVIKNDVKPREFINVETDLNQKINHYFGERKPSIDSAVHALIYKHNPDIVGLFHFHDGIVIPDAITNFPYPCGSLEEGLEIIKVIKNDSFAIKLIDHGYLLGFTFNGLNEIEKEWQEVWKSYHEHLVKIGYLDSDEKWPDHLKLMPIFHSVHIVGVLVHNTKDDFVSCYLMPEMRNLGIGKKVIAYIKENELTVAVHRKCIVRKYYKKHGFKIIRTFGSLTFLKFMPDKPQTSGTRKCETWHGIPV